ncbi:MAG TPA: hypothetical protein VFB60_05590 [Ktedonobacteraceae bacterium]|nr:hypothetical protein [Ktedonobacteraceae bacterium]
MVQQTREARLLHHPSPQRERHRREHAHAMRIRHILSRKEVLRLILD